MGVINDLLTYWKHVTTDFDRNMEAFWNEHFAGEDDKAEKKGRQEKEDESAKEQGKKGECTDGNKKYKEGEQWSDLDVCNLKICHPRGVISVRKCPEWRVQPPCRQEQLPSTGHFPECCPSVVCPTSK